MLKFLIFSTDTDVEDSICVHLKDLKLKYVTFGIKYKWYLINFFFICILVSTVS